MNALLGVKRSECRCPCHTTGAVHCVPCCVPDPIWPEVTQEQVEQIDKALAPEFATGNWQTIESE